MVRWELMSLRLVLPIMAVVQLFIGAGTVIGFGFLFRDISRVQALYLATGGSVIALLMVGLALAPQLIAQRKSQKTYEYVLSFPVPRPILALSGVTVWILVTLPGTALALGAAAWWYGLELSVSPEVLPAVLLTVLMASSLGIALGHAVSHPSVIALISQVLVFVILLYSPINYPAERLPQWLQAVHEALPFKHAALVMRGALTEGLVGATSGSFLILSLWTAGAWVVTLWVLGRRR
jgi:ABC-2 type transport system permease protein